jgi:lysophospholipase L1-like esterase
MPRAWYPGPRNFHVYKPDVTLTARPYGEFYVPAMLRSATLVDSLLDPRQVTYAIGRHGLREREPLTGTRLFALGDSFVFGYATDEGGVWTDQLGAALGEGVYNMGVSGTSPRSQLLLLEHMLLTQSDSMRIGRLLWMIFEGNDLEDDYALSWQPPVATGSSILDGTVLQALGSLPGRLKSQSILRRALAGELVVTGRSAVPGLDDRRVFDGITLAAPLYRSERWGYRLFAASDVRQVTTSPEYLLEHPNRPLLDETFEAMRRLAETHGFEVLVIVAPSASRVYGNDFEGFPELSAEPYFANYVLDLARAQGFASLDLLEGLKPFAREEFLYFRDDHHWNERGNEIAAQLIAEVIARLDGPRQAPPSR